jgi:hypothetical protein
VGDDDIFPGGQPKKKKNLKKKFKKKKKAVAPYTPATWNRSQHQPRPSAAGVYPGCTRLVLGWCQLDEYITRIENSEWAAMRAGGGQVWVTARPPSFFRRHVRIQSRQADT